MHKTDVARPVLPARPVKREIIEIVAEIGSRRARSDRREALRPQMPGELRGRNCRVQAAVGAIKDRAPVENGAARILPEVDQIVRRALNAEPLRALMQAEMQGQSRPMVLNQAWPKPRNLGPLGGQHFGMSRSMSAATSDAVTAAVAPSGPAMAKGRELRTATMAALIVVVTKVAAMP